MDLRRWLLIVITIFLKCYQITLEKQYRLWGDFYIEIWFKIGKLYEISSFDSYWILSFSKYLLWTGAFRRLRWSFDPFVKAINISKSILTRWNIDILIFIGNRRGVVLDWDRFKSYKRFPIFKKCEKKRRDSL